MCTPSQPLDAVVRYGALRRARCNLPLLQMKSNSVSQSKLKLVKGSIEDKRTMEIVTRMGMSVTDFMNSLNCPKSKADVSRLFVWPKHTDLEIGNSNEAVYQYESGDNSWALRFRALGCYSIMPRQFSEAMSLRKSTHLADSLGSTGQDPSKSNHAQGDRDRLHSILKSRCSSRSEFDLPCETITQAERHKLLEDLRLTDSEDESSSASAVNDDKVIDNADLDSDLHLRTAEKAFLSETDSGVALPPSIFGTSEAPSIDRTLDPSTECVQSPGANMPQHFTNPVSSATYATVLDRSCPTLAMQDNRPVTPEILTELNSGSGCKVRMETNLFHEQSVAESRSSAGKCALGTPKFDGSATGKQSPATGRLRQVFRNVRDVQCSETEPNCTLPMSSAPKVLTSANSVSASPITEQKGSQKDADFVRRVLLESETVLADEQSFFVARLSSPSPEMYKDPNRLLLNKENLLSSPTEGESCESSRLPISCSASKQSSCLMNPIGTFVGCHRSEFLPPKGVPETFRCSPSVSDALAKKSSFGENSENCSLKNDQDNLCPREIMSSASDGRRNELRIENQASACDQKDDLVTSGLCQWRTHTNLDDQSQGPESNEKLMMGSTVEAKTNCALKMARDSSILSDGEPQDDQDSIPPYQPHSSHETCDIPLNRKTLGKPVNLSTKKIVSADCSDPLSHNSAMLETIWKNEIQDAIPDHSSPSRSVCPVYSEMVRNSRKRKAPEKQWVFSNIALRQMRSKLRSAICPSRLEKFGCVLRTDPLDNVRALLLSMSSSQQSNSDNNDCNSRLRTLTGVLLVPPQIRPIKKDHIHASPQVRSTSESRNVSMLTSSMQYGHLSVAVQCSAACERSTTVCNVECQSSPHFETLSWQSKFSSSDAIMAVRRLSDRLSNERRILLNSSVDNELASGDKCKENASRCWKSLVNTVSNFQSDSENLESDRSHLLLTLDSLHLYPVHSMQGIRRYLGAVFLLHSQGDFAGAVDLCAKVSVQLENINRRLKRVETKLIKHRSRRQRTTPGSSESASNIGLSSPISRAKRDAGWIHFWYYVLIRIRSVVHWHEFQFRMVSDPSLFCKEENEFPVLLDSGKQTENSNICDADGAKSVNNPSDRGSNSSISKLGPTVCAGSKFCQSGSVSPKSMEVDSIPSADSIKPLGGTRFERLHKLGQLMHQSSQEWIESVRLASSVASLLGYSPLTCDSSDPMSPIGDIVSTSVVEHTICNAAGGIHTGGQCTDILTLLCFIDGVVRIHTKLLEYLRFQRSSSGMERCTLWCRSWDETPNVEQSITPISPSVPEPKPNLKHDGMPASLEEGSQLSVSGNQRCRPQCELISTNDEPCSGIVGCSQLLVGSKESSVGLVFSEEERKQVNRKCFFEVGSVNNISTSAISSKRDNCAAGASSIFFCERRMSNLSHSVINLPSTLLEKDIKGEEGGHFPDSDSNDCNGHLRLETSSQGKRHTPVVRSCDAESPASEAVLQDPLSNDRMTADNLSPTDSVSPSYAASTPSPPLIRRRSKSLAPVRPWTHSPKGQDCVNVKKLTGASSVKRKGYTNTSHCSDNSEETTYKPKRIRPMDSESRQSLGEALCSSSLETSPFPSYQPSDPDEIDRARLRRCVSVGRGLSRAYQPGHVVHISSLGHENRVHYRDGLAGASTLPAKVSHMKFTNSEPKNNQSAVPYPYPKASCPLKSETHNSSTASSYQDKIHRAQPPYDGSGRKYQVPQK